MRFPRRHRHSAKRTADTLAIGAYTYAARPGPAGVDELGRHFIDTEGGIDAAFGWVLWRLHRLEHPEP